MSDLKDEVARAEAAKAAAHRAAAQAADASSRRADAAFDAAPATMHVHQDQSGIELHWRRQLQYTDSTSNVRWAAHAT